MPGGGAGHFAIDLQQIDHAEIALAGDAFGLVHDGAERLRHRGPGVEEIHIDAARPVMARRERRGDLAVLPGPADAPGIHLLDAFGALLAEQPRQRLVAEAAAGGQRVLEVIAPMVRRLGAERDGNRHLRHHGGAAAADQASVDQQHLTAGAGGLDRGVHPGRAGADHQHIGLQLNRLGRHEGNLSLRWANRQITPAAAFPLFPEGKTPPPG